MLLSVEKLRAINTAGISIPSAENLVLPERVLQFGTGVLLRGLPDFYIDQANKKGVFNGRIVVVKSTDTGSTDAFEQQNNLYTILIRGFENGVKVETNSVNASISRVLTAQTQWESVLACAQNPLLQIVLSNTTEVGISLTKESIHNNPPASFPGKLLAFLYTRYQYFKGSTDAGMVIVPTELISNNGSLLKSIVLELAEFNQLEKAFIVWLNESNDFCNSLVDRIVPGMLAAAEKVAAEKELGYTDNLMIMSEPYSLWAIETSQARSKSILSFSQVNEGVKLADDIQKFKEIKLRLLNATHTFSCGVAILAGFQTVREAMDANYFRNYVTNLMLQEIRPLLIGNLISEQEATTFANNVIDRFRNPFIEHKWINISAQFSLKMAMRNLPLIKKHYTSNTQEPILMLLGFAAYILFMQSVKTSAGFYERTIGANSYVITDEKAALLHQYWQLPIISASIAAILSDTSIWGEDLLLIPRFSSDLVKMVANFNNKNIEQICATLHA
jgi:tagaturonate reductase